MKTQQQCRSCGKAVYDGHVHACSGIAFSEPLLVPITGLDKRLKVLVPVTTLAKLYALLLTIDQSEYKEIKKELMDLLDGN